MENPFKYSEDPELNSIFDKLVSLKKKTNDALEKATKIAGIGDTQGFLELKPCKIDLPNYENRRHSYDSYIKTPLTVIESEVRKAIELAQSKIDEVKALNAPLLAANSQLKADITSLMTKLGIPTTYTTYEFPTSRSKTKKAVVHTAGYVNDLTRRTPTCPAAAASYTLSSYVQRYEYWLKSEKVKEENEKAEKDQETIRVHVIGNPEMIGLLMNNGVNVLDVMQKAVAGKKIDAIKYSAVQTINNLMAAADPDTETIKKIRRWHDCL